MIYFFHLSNFSPLIYNVRWNHICETPIYAFAHSVEKWCMQLADSWKSPVSSTKNLSIYLLILLPYYHDAIFSNLGMGGLDNNSLSHIRIWNFWIYLQKHQKPSQIGWIWELVKVQIVVVLRWKSLILNGKESKTWHQWNKV